MSRFEPEKVAKRMTGNYMKDIGTAAAAYGDLYAHAEAMAEAIERWRETGEDGDLDPTLAAYRGEGQDAE